MVGEEMNNNSDKNNKTNKKHFLKYVVMSPKYRLPT
jgi:hypothetical protein